MQNWRKFSAVLGTMLRKSSKVMRPRGSPKVERLALASCEMVKHVMSTYEVQGAVILQARE